MRRRGLQGPFLVAWSLPIERHKGLVELARCRSDLSLRLLVIACCVMDSLIAQAVAADAAGAAGLDTHMPGIERFALGHHGPQDVCVLVGQRHGGLLPAGAVPECCGPLGDGVGAAGLCAKTRPNSPSRPRMRFDARCALGLEPCRPRHAAGIALRQAQTVLRTV